MIRKPEQQIQFFHRVQALSVLFYRLTRNPNICLENKHILTYECLAIRQTGSLTMRNVNNTERWFLCKHCSFLRTARQISLRVCIYSTSGGHNLWAPDRPGAKIFPMAPNICGSTAGSFLHVTLLAPRIWRWFQEFGKCVLLYSIDILLYVLCVYVCVCVCACVYIYIYLFRG